ncbi:MAG: MarR family winged helix-turn-helix transcriptional regulator [Nocardioidaceae bacterium]
MTHEGPTEPSAHGKDPTEESRWRPVRILLAAVDGEIARLYDERDLSEIRPRFTMPLIRLGHRGAMTVRQLADSLDVTHSAMSQTVAALRRSGLVSTSTGADARTRPVDLTERGRSVLPFLEAEWQATERALAELEAETPYPLSQVVRDLETALARRSFHDRVTTQLRDRHQ